jgi:hypothetical protein
MAISAQFIWPIRLQGNAECSKEHGSGIPHDEPFDVYILCELIADLLRD